MATLSESVDAILQQIIWFNSNILIKRLPILLEYLVRKSSILVNDVMDLNGIIYSYKTFCELAYLVNCVQNLDIIS